MKQFDVLFWLDIKLHFFIKTNKIVHEYKGIFLSFQNEGNMASIIVALNGSNIPANLL